MWGISYGGFTAIQVAALRPPHLRAIVPVMATDDRYLDDVHYRGGCVTVSELSPVRGQPGRDERDATRCGVPRRGVARRMAGPARRDAAVAVRLAPAPGRRAVLAAGVARAGLRRDRGRDLQHRRLARQLRRPGVPDAGSLPGAVAHARRQLGPLVAARRRRPARTSTSCTRSPGSSIDTSRRRQRLGRRAADRLVRARVRAARAVPGRAARVDGGRRPPIRIPRRRPADGVRGGQSAAGRAARRRRARRRRPTRRGVDAFRHRPTTGTRGALSWGAGGAPERPRPRPPPRRGRRPDLHVRAARRGARGPRRARGRSSTSRSTRRSRRCRFGSATSRRTGRRAWSVPGC